MIANEIHKVSTEYKFDAKVELKETAPLFKGLSDEHFNVQFSKLTLGFQLNRAYQRVMRNADYDLFTVTAAFLNLFEASYQENIKDFFGQLKVIPQMDPSRTDCSGLAFLVNNFLPNIRTFLVGATVESDLKNPSVSTLSHVASMCVYRTRLQVGIVLMDLGFLFPKPVFIERGRDTWILTKFGRWHFRVSHEADMLVATKYNRQGIESERIVYKLEELINPFEAVTRHIPHRSVLRAVIRASSGEVLGFVTADFEGRLIMIRTADRDHGFCFEEVMGVSKESEKLRRMAGKVFEPLATVVRNEQYLSQLRVSFSKNTKAKV